MRFFILSNDYPKFLSWFYAAHLGLLFQPYEVQVRARTQTLYDVIDFYVNNLQELGHEIYSIQANNEFLQKAWWREYGISVQPSVAIKPFWQNVLQQARYVMARTSLRRLRSLFRPMLYSLESQQAWMYEILAAQIRYYQPDILINQSMAGIDNDFLREMKRNVRLLVGQVASPFPEDMDFSYYDLVISSLPNFVEYFQQRGIQANLHRFAFEPTVLSRLKAKRRKIPVSFVGSISRFHNARNALLEHLCDRFDISIWGQIVDDLPKNSPILKHYRGEAWGVDMYQVLYDSKITINRHIGVAENYANNIRLFEATGVGTLLITDWKINLDEIFEPGKEVVTYRTPQECAELIQYYLEHEDERASIARAGQERTLREHTYSQRMKELVAIIEPHLS